ncbi:MAG TPA: carboxypeptidase regulatory-like domain-containing protein, partial [Bryobacteraceae bacterium]|nr:carboxypeptidase regulatory-like domain-containing protein [Bryobacteraceae bacterium]
MKLLGCAFAFCGLAFAQGNRGSITGTVTDPAGAVVVNVAVEGKNLESGGLYKTASTTTGNYTLSELPPGNYEVTFAAPGFKTFKRGPLEVGARQILRIDGTLEVGTAAESITVSEAAPLLITESSEVGYNVSTNRLNDLPVGNMGSVRNIVRSAAVLMPGVSFSEGFFGGVKINGTPADGYNLRIDGMDNTYTLGNLLVTQVQPSVDAIEQYSIQTSNFAAELGQAGGAIFNVNMKSGTNQFHGSAFDYWSTDTFYAAQPYTKLKSPTSNYDWGFTVGGPVWVPKVYNGHDKTFFFFSYETRPQEGTNLTTFNTVPTDDYRLGKLSAAMSAVGNKVLGKDPLGRNIIQNQAYDPDSNFTQNGQVLRNPFTNNQIPVARFDPVSAKLLTLVPKANLPGLIQNYNNPYATASKQYLPSFKIDHNINASNKLNFFFSRTTQRSPITTGEGFPTQISNGTISDWINKNYRLNYDRTITPTMLLHLGVGYQDATIGQLPFEANTPYDATTALGLKGPFFHGEGSTFPHFGSNNLAPGTGMSNGQGGLSDLGNASFNGTTLTKNQRPTAIATLTWVKNNHTYKFGGELRVDGFPAYNLVNLNGYYAFSGNETALPYLNSATLAGNTLGFPFASFLLGQVDQGNVSSPANAKLGQHSLGFFAQDTWKVTRKLTLDYGLRWDYSTYQKEQYGRYPTLDPRAPNASAGGHPGGVTYEATCGCRFAPNYPYAWGPRLGAAYQIDRKTVVRGGIGLMYNTSARIGIAGRSLGSNNPFTSPSFGEPAMVLGTGVQATYQQIAWPNFNPNYYPVFGRSPGAGPANVFDQNAARPARQLQWSIGVQREIFRDLVIEVSYVGNTGVWWTAAAAVNYNTLQPSTLQSLGIDINNPADVTLLNSQIGSAAVKAR